MQKEKSNTAIKENLWMIDLMEKVMNKSQMDGSTTVSSRGERKDQVESRCAKTAVFTRANSSMTSSMDAESSPILPATHVMRVTGTEDRCTAAGYIFGLMDDAIKESTNLTKKKASACICGPMDVCITVCGRMVSRMEKALKFNPI